MNRRLFLSNLLAAGATLWLPERAWGGSEIVVIAHKGVNVKRLAEGELRAIFTTRMRQWPKDGRIVPFNFPAKSPSRVAFDKAVLHMSPDQVARFWIDRRVRGGNRPPRQVPTPTLMVKVVSKLEGAVGYVPASAAKGNVRIIARIRGSEVVDP